VKKIEQKISPAGFDFLQRELLAAENRGMGPNDAVGYACSRVGLWPKEYTETVLVVDYTLDGPVWPFMDWPKYWDKHDRSTWR
jgi:hypothetical protein